MDLNQNCSRHFTYRDLIECGETFQWADIQNLPQESESWQALSDLAKGILDPVVEQFGELQLTYGFCSPELARARRRFAKAHQTIPSIYPPSDQHAAHERDDKGQFVCARGGAACDFIVPDMSSLAVALWIVRHLPFDRLYYYAPDRPVHVSYTEAGGCGELTIMKPKTVGRGYIPTTITAEQFLERFADEL